MDLHPYDIEHCDITHHDKARFINKLVGTYIAY
jgi:hypothetical protein